MSMSGQKAATSSDHLAASRARTGFDPLSTQVLRPARRHSTGPLWRWSRLPFTRTSRPGSVRLLRRACRRRDHASGGCPPKAQPHPSKERRKRVTRVFTLEATRNTGTKKEKCDTSRGVAPREWRPPLGFLCARARPCVLLRSTRCAVLLLVLVPRARARPAVLVLVLLPRATYLESRAPGLRRAGPAAWQREGGRDSRYVHVARGRGRARPVEHAPLAWHEDEDEHVRSTRELSGTSC